MLRILERRRLVKRVAQSGLLFALLFCGAQESWPQDRSERALRIKAAIVYHLIKFIEWPDDRLKPVGSINLCFVGEHALLGAIAQSVAGKTVRSRQIVTKRLRNDVDTQGLDECHAVVVHDRVSQLANPLLELNRRLPLAVLCHDYATDWEGCTLTIEEQNNKAKVGIDLELATKAGLTVSSELLELATIRGTARKGGK